MNSAHSKETYGMWAVLVVVLAALAGGSQAFGAVSVLDSYSLGDSDGGAIVGNTIATTVDAVGGKPLTATGSPVYSAAGGPPTLYRFSSIAATFDGSSSLGTATVLSTATDNFGIDAWVYSTTTAGDGVIAHNGVNFADGWGLLRKGTTYVGVFGGITFVGSEPVTLNAWTHLALVRQNAVATFYVNGVASSAPFFGAPNPPIGGGFHIASDSSGGTGFTGAIDEIRVFTFVAGQFSIDDIYSSCVVKGNGVIIPSGKTLASSADSTYFGDVPNGSNASQTFTILNTSTSSLSINSISMRGANANEFSISGITFPTDLAAAASTSFVVTLNSTSSLARLGVVSIDLTPAGNPFTYSYTVQGNNNYVVTTTADSGNGSLRNAIDSANVVNSVATISFDPTLTAGGPATITLSTSGDTTFDASAFGITTAITLQGPTGANGVTLSASGGRRLFYVSATGNLTLNSLTLSGGTAQGDDGGNGAGAGGGGAGLGGAIYNLGTLAIANSVLSGCTARGGNGGNGGGVTRGNGGGPNGGVAGATSADPGGDGGFGSGGGGSLNSNGGRGGFGGGGGGSGPQPIPSFGGFGGGNGATSTYEGGGGAGLGGAVFSDSGNVTITNSTLTGNSAQGGSVSGIKATAGLGLGGAVFIRNGSLTLLNTTISGNTAAQGGCGVCVLGDGATAMAAVNNTLIGQSDTSVFDFVAATYNGGAVTSSGGGNLIRTQATATDALFIGFVTVAGPGFNGTVVSTADPILAALGKYGGPTQTLALLPGSPAIDAGTGSGSDQRGLGMFGSAKDIGAFESQGFTFSGQIGTSQTALVNTPFTNSLNVNIMANSTIEPVNGGVVTFTAPGSGASLNFTTFPATISSGVASYSATANGASGGPYTVAATATGALPTPVNFSLTNVGFYLSPSTLPNWTANASGYNQTLSAAGGTGAKTFAVTNGAIPTGMTLSTGGVLSGIPTTTGTFNFIVTATDTVSLTGQQAYTVVVNPVVTVSPASLPNWTANKSGYSQTLSATGGTGSKTLTLSAGAIPTGMAFNGGTGVLSGTPTVAGTFNVTIQATDSVSATGSVAYTVVINPPVKFTTASLPNPALNAAGYSQALATTGGTGALVFAVIAGSVPTGTTLSPAGVLAGTPSVAGTFAFAVSATDSVGSADQKVYVLTVLGATGSIAITSQPSATPNPASAGQTVQLTVAATGASALSYAWDFGDGATGSGANVTHAYTTPSTYSAMVTISDTAGVSVQGTVSVTVIAASEAPNLVTVINPVTGVAIVTTGGSGGAFTFDAGQAFSPITAPGTAPTLNPQPFPPVPDTTFTITNPDGTTLSGAGPSFTATLLSAGIYTVTVQGPAGILSSKELIVTQDQLNGVASAINSLDTHSSIVGKLYFGKRHDSVVFITFVSLPNTLSAGMHHLSIGVGNFIGNAAIRIAPGNHAAGNVKLAMTVPGVTGTLKYGLNKKSQYVLQVTLKSSDLSAKGFNQVGAAQSNVFTSTDNLLIQSTVLLDGNTAFGGQVPAIWQISNKVGNLLATSGQ